jgi:hypothetical protein
MVRYLTRLDLMGQSRLDPEVVQDRMEMLADSGVQMLIADLKQWPGKPIVRHNDASHLLHKLVFVSELGVELADAGVQQIVEKVKGYQGQDGAFDIFTRISRSFGGTGEDQRGWMLCDTPSVLYSLARIGGAAESDLQKSARHLAERAFDRGWPCVVSASLGKFRGPGRKSDPCPYATLVSLKALSQFPEWRDTDLCVSACSALLELWEHRRQRRPYMFAMGTDFVKLKAPEVWYDIVHVIDVLSRFPKVRSDERLLEMAGLVEAKVDDRGRFRSESVWKAWSGWEFGQKTQPSFWLTLTISRALQRIHGPQAQL